MNKKDMTRTSILKARDGFMFTNSTLAQIVGVTEKDVSNVTLELAKAGALLKEKQPDGTHKFIVNANVTQLYFAKHPISGKDRLLAKPGGDVREALIAEPVKRNKPRTPFIRAIDDEIHAMETKIRHLKKWRREYE